MFEAERPHLVRHAGRFDGFHAAAGVGLEDLPRSLRQQQVLGQRQRRRATRRDPGLCRSRGDPPGRPHRRPNILGPSAAARRSAIPGTTSPSSPASPARCVTAPRSRTGFYPRRSIASRRKLAGSRRRRSSDGEDPRDGAQRRPTGGPRAPAPRRWSRASPPPTSSSTSSRGSAIPRRRSPS